MPDLSGDILESKSDWTSKDFRKLVKNNSSHIVCRPLVPISIVCSHMWVCDDSVSYIHHPIVVVGGYHFSANTMQCSLYVCGLMHCVMCLIWLLKNTCLKLDTKKSTTSNMPLTRL